MADYETAKIVFEYVKSCAIVLSPLLVIIGWIFVDKTNNKRECRKELYALIKDLNDFADDLTELGVEYLRCDGAKKSETLKYSIMRQDKVLAAMFKNLKDIMHTGSSETYIKYRNVLTATFDDPVKKSHDENSEEIRSLYGVLSELKIELLTEFYKQSPVRVKKN